MGDLALVPPMPDTWSATRSTQADYMAIVIDAITNHPRSLQTAIGPSEIGTPCTRKLGHKLAGTQERAGMPPNWKATVGTAIHAWLEEAIDNANQVWAAANGNHGVERWLIEERVTVGAHLDGTPITGSCDLYDRLTRTVVDHKTTSKTQLKQRAAGHISDTYRIQAHLYGQGWINAGFPVETVAICSLPRDGELRDAVWWSEPFNPQIAADALQRLHGVEMALATLGAPSALALLPMVDDYCGTCEFKNPRTATAADGCPGIAPEATPPALTLSN